MRAAAAARANAVHASPSRPLRRLPGWVEDSVCESSAIHCSSRLMSAALCQRSSASLARQVLTTRSSVGGVIGWIEEIGAGSADMIAEINDAWLAPEKAFLPVAIS